MAAEESLREGRLEQALTELQDRVRGDPANAKYRIFLFQLLAVMGQWNRAATQLELSGELDSGALVMVQAYREALRCEVFRGEVFSGERTPLLFGQPEQWMAMMVEAARLSAGGHISQAQELRAQAFESAPVTSGTIDGKRFEWIADADTRFGPILEAVVNGGYYWIPYQHIQKVQIDEPVDLRDSVWMPAHFVWANGGDSVGLIPTRYPGSEVNEESSIRLARRTEWIDHGNDYYTGLGQRMFATDAGEYPLLDVRLIDLDTEQTENASSG